MFVKKITGLFIVLCIITGCAQNVDFAGNASLKEKKTGSLTIVRENQTRSGFLEPDKQIVVSDIITVNVTVSGYGFSDITKVVTGVTNGTGTNITIDDILVGNNRVITIQPFSSNGEMQGVALRGIVNIVAGSNSTYVTWSTTGLGNIFYELLKTHSYNISGISTADITTLSGLVTGAGVSHQTLVHYVAIAADYKANLLKPAGASVYKLTPASATFLINNVTDFADYKAHITDPASSVKELLVSGTNTITGLTPGVWQLVIYKGTDIVYRSALTSITTGETKAFGGVDFVVSKPVISPAEPLFSSATLSVTITTTTIGASIYYTTNGSVPTTGSTLYSAPFSISATTTIKAIAVKPQFVNSQVETKEYTKQISSTIGENHPATGTFSPVDSGSWASATWSLGSHFAGSDVTFAVYSKNATRILLEIYETETSTTNTKKGYGTSARYDYWMTKGSDNIWRAKLASVPAKTYYAFRAWGPNWTFSTEWLRGNSNKGFISDVDDNGNRFNPNKVLFDPYTRELSHDKEFPEMDAAGESGGMYGTGGSATLPTAQMYSGTTTTGGVSIDSRNVDTGRWVPKGIILQKTNETFTKPTFAEESSVMYEAHVRGISAHNSVTDLQTILSGMSGFEAVVNVPAEYRGTYRGAGFLAKYLKSIGVNTIELLPVHETENDMMPFDGSQPTLGGAKNFWGYMTYGFFAPDRRYAFDKSAGGPVSEFQQMVKTLNAEGIKVFLDVVYNHTGEGGNWGKKDVTGFVSMGGFDTAEYYHLVPGGTDKNVLVDGATGCGNQLNLSKTVNHNLVLDSLTYWIDDMGVSGFRFDLAAVLGRKPDSHAWEPSDTYWSRVKAFYSDHQTLVAMADLGQTKGVWMIAEAWDMWGYPVGNFPGGWGEWNGRYRDSVRKYMTGDTSGHDGVKYTDAFYGDYNHFNDQGGPHKSINFLVAHDGFTLTDLVSYGLKQNTSLSWPFGPSDGGENSNFSWDSNGSQSLRRQRLRNFWTFQMFSRGTPMIVYGDELGRTQNGNNNPYNIDSAMTWNNYSMINADAPQNISTGYGGSYHNNLGTDALADGKNNIFKFSTYLMKLRRDTAALHAKNYSETIGYTTETGAAFTTGKAIRIWRGDFLICSNMGTANLEYTIPAASSGKGWARIVDTGSWAEAYNNYWDIENAAEITGSYSVNAWSMVVLKQVEKTVMPVVNPSESFTDTYTITATTTTTGAQIRYTTDGTEPTVTSTVFPGAGLAITSTTTFKARTFKPGVLTSAVASAIYTNNAAVELPVVSLNTSKFWKEITIFAHTKTAGATLRYTITGIDPVAGDLEFPATGVSFTTTSTLKVKGFKDGLSDSQVTTATYTKQTDTTYTESPYGVMLQGFHWGSASDAKTWYSIIRTNASDIKNTFEYVWFPPPSATPSFSKQGYIPTDLNDLNSYYGSADELKLAISDISPAKAIADIVVNHRGGSVGWGQFENPRWDIDYQSITSDDEGFTATGSDMKDWPGPKGALDYALGGYAAARDLDHTNVNVQKGIETWMNSVLKDAGFMGWRYDYVKGFHGKYVGQYNKNTSAGFSVGEYWPTAGFDPLNTAPWSTSINAWVTQTAENAGQSSRVFDFVLKGNFNYAFGYADATPANKDLWDMSRLAHTNNIFRSNPNDAVTFVDNHDTGSSQHHWELDPADVAIANVFILTHPGYPSVSWEHYFNNKTHIQKLIQIRKDAKIKNTSAITVLAQTTTNYAAEITGDDGHKIVVKIGGDLWSPTPNVNNYFIVYSGTNFCIWKNTGMSGDGDFGNTLTGTVDKTFTIYNNSTVSYTTTDKLSISGTGASAFSVTSSPATTVSSSGSATFVVRFNPASDGVYNALLTLSDGNTINLAGKRNAVTKLRTYRSTIVGQNVYFGYRVRNGTDEAQTWTTIAGSYSTGTQSGNNYNWVCTIDCVVPSTTIEWKALVKQDGQSDIWMGGVGDRVVPSGLTQFSEWNTNTTVTE